MTTTTRTFIVVTFGLLSLLCPSRVTSGELLGDGKRGRESPQYGPDVPNIDDTAKHRPTIYTYFEYIPIENRTTGMSDKDNNELLQYWKVTWAKSGWNPVVLSRKDAERHPNYTTIESKLQELHLDFLCQTSFRKWLAMTTTIEDDGGWYAEYDVFPLWNVSTTSTSILNTDFPPKQLPNNGFMTVHDIVSPSLVSGRKEQWYQSLMVLLEDARNHTTSITYNSDDEYPQKVQTFWTDSMGIHSLQQSHHPSPSIVTAPKSTRQVMLAFGRNDPVVTKNPKDCQKLVKKWAVQVGRLQQAVYVPPKYRLPKYRLLLAKKWVSKFQSVCSAKELQPKEK